jgi:hypothetical protein
VAFVLAWFAFAFVCAEDEKNAMEENCIRFDPADRNVKLESRVTRLGEFSPTERLFTLGRFFIEEVAQLFWSTF